jgi:hypothetical protein
MKHLLFIMLATIILTACSSEPQSAASNASTPTPIVDPIKPADFIANIKIRFQEVNKNKSSYEEIVRKYNLDPQEGKFIAWKDGDSYAMIREEMYDDHGPMFNDYYFEKGRCVFIFAHSELDEMETGVTHITQDRYYMNNGVLLLHYNKRKKFAKGEVRDMDALPNEEMLVNGEEDGDEVEFQVKDAIKRFEALAGK